MDLAKVVTVARPYEWNEGSWALGRGYAKKAGASHVVAYDYGVKRNILRLLVERGARVTVVPAATPAKDVLRMKPDGVFLSNGPGDPEPCDYAIESIGRDPGHHETAGVRHLPRPPVDGPRLGREDPEDEIRPPRRQPPGEGPGHRRRW